MSSRLAPGLRFVSSRVVTPCLVAAMCAPAFAQSGGHPEDTHWESPFGTPGMGTGAREAVVVDDELYVSDATYVDAARFAIWDGTSWRTDGPGVLSAGHGLNDMARIGSDIYIAGNFTSIGGVNAAYVARWDGSAWHALGSGVNGNVIALATDGNGNLYVGGTFTQAGGEPARHVAKWDGASWSTLSDITGSGDGVNGNVTAIAVGNSRVYVGGAFTEAGQQAATSVASWNWTTGDWEPVGGGVRNEGFQYGGIVDIGVSGETVYVAGDIDWAINDGGETAVGNVAVFENDTWGALGGGSATAVPAMLVTPGGGVFAAGDFSSPPTGRIEGVAEWNGSTWTPLKLDEYAWETAELVWYDGSVVAIAAQGPSETGSVRTNGIARWTGSHWTALGQGVSGPVNAIVEHGGAVYAGGDFYFAGEIEARSLARWDGSGWSALGAGLPVNSSILPVSSLASTPSGLVAAGYFSEIGGVSATNIALWDGSGWNPMGDGLRDFGFSPSIKRVQYEDGTLYAGGSFLLTGSQTIRGLARWTGSAWEAVGGGAREVETFAAGNGLVVVGSASANLEVDFGPTGNGVPQSTDNVAIWDGTVWSGTGGGVSGSVRAIAFAGPEIIVGGEFTMAGSVAANNIARFDGTTWQTFGDGVNGRVRAIFVNGSDVYVGGDFTEASGTAVRGLARWDGLGWHELGSGLLNATILNTSSGSVRTLAGTDDGLFVGGSFTFAGGWSSQNIATWSDYIHVGVGAERPVELPHKASALDGNYPNPFSRSTTFRFELDAGDVVSLELFDALGRLVAAPLERTRLASGFHEVVFDGSALSPGTYLYRLTSSGRTDSGSLVIFR